MNLIANTIIKHFVDAIINYLNDKIIKNNNSDNFHYYYENVASICAPVLAVTVTVPVNDLPLSADV